MAANNNSFEHDGHILTWQEFGEGEHLFILLPGWSSVNTMWSDTIAALLPFGRCVTLDLPGHYPANVPTQYDCLPLEEFIDLMTRAVQHISQGKQITLIGHSTGGLASLGIAERLPNQVRRVVFICGVVSGKLTGVLGLAQRLLRANLYPVFWSAWRLTQLSLVTQMLGMMFYVHRWSAHWRNQSAWQVARDTRGLFQNHNLYQISVLLRMLETYNISAVSSRLTMPVLVMTGTDDPIVPPKQARWLASHLSNAELKEFERVGHVPFFEAREEYEASLLDWLARHPVDRLNNQVPLRLNMAIGQGLSGAN